MAAEHDEHDPADEHAGDPAGKPAKGGKGGKGAKGAAKVLSGPHGTEIMVICSVVLVLFGWLSIRKTKATANAAAATPANSLTAQAAGLAGSGSLAGFDQNAFQGLQYALANQSDQLATLLSGMQGGAAAGTPSGLPGGTTPQSSPSLPSPLPNPPAQAGIPGAPASFPDRPSWLGPLSSVNNVIDPAMHSVTGYVGQTTYGGTPDGGTFSPSGYTAPTGQPAIGSKLLDANGNVAGVLSSYTFNGMPQFSNINMNTFDAAKAAGRYQ